MAEEERKVNPGVSLIIFFLQTLGHSWSLFELTVELRESEQTVRRHLKTLIKEEIVIMNGNNYEFNASFPGDRTKKSFYKNAKTPSELKENLRKLKNEQQNRRDS